PCQRAQAPARSLASSVRKRSHLIRINGATATGPTVRGRHVTAVALRRGKEEKQFRAREVSLAAGGILSPAFLLRSGIGPQAQLREHGIEVRANLRGVGENLSNHAIIFIGLLQRPGARQPASVRPHPMTAFRYSSGLPGAPAGDMYINV